MSDKANGGFGKHYDECLAGFRREVLALEESLSELSAGLLFYKHGVINGLYVVELWELVVAKGTKGNGTMFMKRLCELADEYGITLVLSVARKGAYGGPVWKATSSRNRLLRFYRRFGFVLTSGSDSTYLLSTMHRKPKH